MKINILITAAVLAASLTTVPALAAASYAGEKLAPQAKVPLAAAEAIATKARPGQITDRELEKEAGGSGLRWSFDIKSQGKTFEVGVDARTGKVLENKAEGAHPD
jgi:uncharacterized membrane protein YkoI